MTDKQTPPDWVIREAEKRAGINLPFPDMTYNNGGAFRALCDMIERYEQPPVDRKVLCAREAITQSHDQNFPSNICHWQWIAVRAIELWEEGFGK
jgi:hypothetical protein